MEDEKEIIESIGVDEPFLEIIDEKRLKNYARLYTRYQNMKNLMFDVPKWKGKRVRDYTDEEWEEVADEWARWNREHGEAGIKKLQEILTSEEYDEMLRYYHEAQERKKKSGFVYHRKGGRGRGGGVYRVG